MEEVKFKKTKTFENNGVLTINYKCKTSGKLQEKIKYLDSYLNDKNSFSMLEVVKYIKTLLQSFKCLELTIEYKDDQKEESIMYSGEKMLSYYVVDKFLKYEFNKHFFRGTIYKNFQNNSEKAKKTYNELMNYADELDNVNSVILSKNQKIIIEVYKLFYGENPDFMDEKINIKFQTMMGILSAYGIDLGEGYSFDLKEYKGNTIPMSLKLSWLVEKMSFLGKLDGIEDSIDLSEEVIKKVKVVGEVINSYSDENNNLSFLIYMSQYVYVNRYEIPLDIVDNQLLSISKDLGCEISQIQKALTISKEINSKLNHKKS